MALEFTPLWSEPVPIPHHAILALGALGLGAVQMVLPKGTTAHCVLGWVWVVLMSGVALSGAFIHGIRTWGPFSPIHLLIPLTLILIWSGIRAARRGNIRSHRWHMLSLFFLALVVTGAFTLLPGRIMHVVIFGSG